MAEKAANGEEITDDDREKMESLAKRMDEEAEQLEYLLKKNELPYDLDRELVKELDPVAEKLREMAQELRKRKEQEDETSEQLAHLYIPARVWSPVSDVKAPFADESFEYYQGMKRLETFSAGLTTLAWLDIGDEGVKRLAPLTQLKHLRLNNTTIKDPKCFEALVNLESLDLGDSYVVNDSLAPLAQMKSLKHLNLLGTLVTDDGLKYLEDLTSMEDLDLYGVKITDAGVAYLEKMSRLRRLNLLGSQVTDSSAEILSQMTELRELNLYRSRITDAGLARLQSLEETGDTRPSLQRRDRRGRARHSRRLFQIAGSILLIRPRAI